MTEPVPPASRVPQPVIIDTDPGIDDVLAIWLALHSPELEVRGISISYGNTTVAHAYRNAVEVLRRAGRRLTLAVGARRPLRRPLAVALETHGGSGFGYAELPPAGVALDWVMPFDRLLAGQPEPVTLVTLGPVTSLAHAIHRDPALVRAKVKRCIAMIGTLAAPGNTTPYTEFNAWCDPEALETVLRAELPIDLVGLDVTRQFVLRAEEIERLGQAPDGLAHWFHDALRFYLEFHRKYEGLDGCVINDVLPIAALIQEDALEFQPQRVAVDLETGDHRGRTRIDPEGYRVRVATAVRTEPVRALLVERVLPWAEAPAASPA
ncbi:MAG TPA: nucleoside hydrolase [Gemmatimonadales bacterium]|nr:nucleoside hydrolase [Gemmatimonadales bacterium]